MEEELQKRFTDCVYFLASPLTCKKGADCEYRHSDIARLNPRECWYWTAGGCLNPTCAFRHPPLEARPETSSESALNHSAAAPVNKTAVPCYFFYNGYCNKGDRCSFLHGPDDSLPTWKSSKTTSVNPDTPQVEKKTSVGSDTGSTPVERHYNSADKGPNQAAEVYNEPEPQSAPSIVTMRNASPQVSGSLYEDSAGGRMNSPLAAAGSTRRGSQVSSDESSDNALEDHEDREEWLESSPGFDVLVDDDRSGELCYEDDPEYMPHHDGEAKELNGQYLEFDFEGNAKYDCAYYGHGFSEPTAEPTHEYSRRESVLDRIMPINQTVLQSNMGSGGQHGRDLRDVLRRRRTVNGHSRHNLSPKHGSSHKMRSEERSRSRSAQRMHRRRRSRFENHIPESQIDDEAFLSANQNGRLRHSPRSWHTFKERHGRPRLLRSEVTGEPASRKRSYPEDVSMFTGPKTLDQIKEEKKRAKGDGDVKEGLGSLGRDAQEDFQGPKSLGEILKQKRRLGSVVDDNNEG